MGKKCSSPQKGFTIIEILVVVSIIGIIGYMLGDIVTRSLRGSQKSSVIGTAKQNGQVALDTITQAIRSSDLAVCLDNQIPNPIGVTTGDTIALYSQDGRYVRLSYQSGSSTLNEDLPTVNFLINNDPTNIDSFPNKVCDTTAAPPQAGSQVILTDIDPTNGVLIQKVGGATPVFTLTKRPGSKDTVTVQFQIKPRITGGGFENQLSGSGAVQFQETIQLR
jgi:prepilin-type N-terminal cleavage/methylation domain-containing protein